MLSEGPVRFNELQRRLFDLTQTTLSKQLKALEEDGLIVRHEYPQIPPKVEYSLSPIGEQFNLVLRELKIWGDAYIECLKENRRGRMGAGRENGHMHAACFLGKAVILFPGMNCNHFPAQHG